MAGGVDRGIVVRVPLRGRRLRAWVVRTHQVEEAPDGTEPISKISARLPVFDEPLWAAAQALALQYLHPVSTFLRLMTPPRAPRARGADGGWAPPPGQWESTPAKILARLAPGRDPAARYAGMVSEALGRGLGAIVVVPGLRASRAILETLQSEFANEAAVVHTGLPPSERAAAMWALVKGEKKLALGGRAASLLPAFPLGAVVVHEDHDLSHKEQRAPYYHSAMAATLRAQASGAALMLASSCPALGRFPLGPGWSEEEPRGRSGRWPAVEVVAPQRQVMPDRAIAALIGAWRAGGRSVVLLPRRAATPAGPGPVEIAAYLSRALPGARVLAANDEGPPDGEAEGDVVVATEAGEWMARGAATAAVALGFDSMLARSRATSVERAFSMLWELGWGLAAGPSRGRLVVETEHPEHHAVQAVTRGDYQWFASRELVERREAELPPFKRLVRLRLRSPKAEAMEQIRGLPGAVVLGPVPRPEGGEEALLKVDNIGDVVEPLRSIIAGSGGGITAEVDPRDW